MITILVAGVMAVCVVITIIALGAVTGYAWHACRVVAVMLESGYGWKDSRSILRDRFREAFALPASHRKRRRFAAARVVRREIMVARETTLELPAVAGDGVTWPDQRRGRTALRAGEAHHEW